MKQSIKIRRGDIVLIKGIPAVSHGQQLMKVTTVREIFGFDGYVVDGTKATWSVGTVGDWGALQMDILAIVER